MAISLAELKTSAVINALRSCQLFAGLPAQDLEKIAVVAVPRSLEKGEYLFHERDRAHGFYAVQRGAINVHRVNATGKIFISHTRLNDKLTIHFTVGNLRTTETHVRAAWELIQTLA